VSPVTNVRRNEKPIILGFLGEEVGTARAPQPEACSGPALTNRIVWRIVI
jgi:hypothetical protein